MTTKKTTAKTATKTAAEKKAEAAKRAAAKKAASEKAANAAAEKRAADDKAAAEKAAAEQAAANNSPDSSSEDSTEGPGDLAGAAVPENAGVIIVTGPRKGRRRAGREFGAAPVTIDLEELTEDQVGMIVADPVLTTSFE